MLKPAILWKPQEVPEHILLYSLAKGRNGPYKLDGVPVTFIRLPEGTLSRHEFYALENGEAVASWNKVRDDNIFFPAEIFTVADAPIDKRYAVMKSGKWQIHPESKKKQQAYHDRDGKFYDACVFPFQPHPAAGNEAFETLVHYVGMLYRTVDDMVELVAPDIKRLNETHKILSNRHEETPVTVFLKNSFESLYHSVNERLEHIVRQPGYATDAEKVSLLKRLGGAYLSEADLPPKAQLVPIYSEPIRFRT